MNKAQHKHGSTNMLRGVGNAPPGKMSKSRHTVIASETIWGHKYHRCLPLILPQIVGVLPDTSSDFRSIQSQLARVN